MSRRGRADDSDASGAASDAASDDRSDDDGAEDAEVGEDDDDDEDDDDPRDNYSFGSQGEGINDGDDPESGSAAGAGSVVHLSLDAAEDYNARLRRRGVVYVARVPPRMTPTKVRTLLGAFGEVTRVYLVEEDRSVRRRRRKLTGNASKRYTEGWVEFARKGVAKAVARSLNSTPISNHKRNAHYGDLWCLKYLRKFQWSHLTEKVAYERRVREQRLRLETMQARKEVQAYKTLVETGQKINKIEERKRRREEKLGRSEEGGQETSKKRRNRQITELVDEPSGKPRSALLAGLV